MKRCIFGGDIILWQDYIFVGTYYGDDYKDYITARTNTKTVTAFYNKKFPDKKIKAFSLKNPIQIQEQGYYI